MIVHTSSVPRSHLTSRSFGLYSLKEAVGEKADAMMHLEVLSGLAADLKTVWYP